MRSIKPCEVSAAMLDPTRAATNNPLAAPAIASPMRSRTWANFLTRDRIVVTHGARRHQVRTFFCGVEGSRQSGSTPCIARHWAQDELAACRGQCPFWATADTRHTCRRHVLREEGS